jgi:hypothetical protein
MIELDVATLLDPELSSIRPLIVQSPYIVLDPIAIALYTAPLNEKDTSLEEIAFMVMVNALLLGSAAMMVLNAGTLDEDGGIHSQLPVYPPVPPLATVFDIEICPTSTVSFVRENGDGLMEREDCAVAVEIKKENTKNKVA